MTMPERAEHDSLRVGIEQAVRGELIDRGSFAQYAGSNASTNGLDTGAILRRLAELEDATAQLHETVSRLEKTLTPALTGEDHALSLSAAAVEAVPVGTSELARRLVAQAESVRSVSSHVRWLTEHLEL
jgi:hypothetical protein